VVRACGKLVVGDEQMFVHVYSIFNSTLSSTFDRVRGLLAYMVSIQIIHIE